jgi:hypothetical protein
VTRASARDRAARFRDEATKGECRSIASRRVASTFLLFLLLRPPVPPEPPHLAHPRGKAERAFTMLLKHKTYLTHKTRTNSNTNLIGRNVHCKPWTREADVKKVFFMSKIARHVGSPGNAAGAGLPRNALSASGRFIAPRKRGN